MSGTHISVKHGLKNNQIRGLTLFTYEVGKMRAGLSVWVVKKDLYHIINNISSDQLSGMRTLVSIEFIWFFKC